MCSAISGGDDDDDDDDDSDVTVLAWMTVIICLAYVIAASF